MDSDEPDLYYGSIAALVRDQGAKKLGVSDHTLYRADWSKPYRTTTAIIRKGKIYTTSSIKILGKKKMSKRPKVSL